jgi:hypothetical protein
MMQVNFNLRYTNVKVSVTCKLQRVHVERRVCPISFSGEFVKVGTNL